MKDMKALSQAGSRGPALEPSARAPKWTVKVGAVLALAVCLGLAATLVAAESDARPLATVYATSNHSPFPLVVANAAGEVRLPLVELSDGAAHFYTFMAGNRPVEFFVIWTRDNVIRTAFDACDVCYRAKLGYRQDGEFMVCGNCGNRFPVAKIGVVTGGCNPAPFASRIDGQELVISASALAAGQSYFP